MATSPKTLMAEELVKQKYPDAFVDDDGDWVYVRVKKTVTGPCPHCGQQWSRKEIEHGNVLGSGGDSTRAWKSAAESLGLI